MINNIFLITRIWNLPLHVYYYILRELEFEIFKFSLTSNCLEKKISNLRMKVITHEDVILTN